MDYKEKRYQHVERFGTDEVQGIELGLCYIFPKIDGTNAVMWSEDGVLQFGSRNRHLNEGKDNGGFMTAIMSEPLKYEKFFEEFPNVTLYGEWLIPHSLKTYRDEAWKKFYVFDIKNADGSYIPYPIYKEVLDRLGIDYIPCLAEGINLTYEQLLWEMNKNTYLIKDGEGLGEGIVIKNYEYVNPYGRRTWAKMVRTEFKEKNAKEFGHNTLNARDMVELEIVNKFLTPEFIDKEYQKLAIDGWNSKKIPQLLGTVFHTFITEEIWTALKEFNMPTINFKTLNCLVIAEIKKVKKELF